MDLLIGTGNVGKLREYQALLGSSPVRCLSLQDVGLANMEVGEEAETFLENARTKALAYAQASGMLALADDTGLLVDVLEGAPGVRSARWGDEGLTMPERCALLLEKLKGVPDEQRGAHFYCVIVLAHPKQGEVNVVEGRCEGRIGHAIDKGPEGFGYDGVFIPDGYTLAWSRIPMEEKNRISHRGQAARRLIPILEEMASKGA